jgi:hypothetical protein
MSKKANDDPVADNADVTREVGDEGGGPGDVEIESDHDAATGSEAGEAWRPTGRKIDSIVRDETGVGRRSP